MRNRDGLFRKLILKILLFSDCDNFDKKYLVKYEERRPVLSDPDSVSWCNLWTVPDFYHIVLLSRVG
mgnify:CR=1 FL=1